jgi:hypothetical protein
MNLDEEIISCSRCKKVCTNNECRVQENFGYKKSGERYKLCYTCRKRNHNPKVVSCCICMENFNLNKTARIKCGHSACIDCMEKWIEKDDMINYNYLKLSDGSNTMFHCPVCKREYMKYNSKELLHCTKFFDYSNIICKCVFQNSIKIAFIEPMQIFTLTTKTNLYFKDGTFYSESQWFKRMKIIVDLLIPIYESDEYKDPLILYVHQESADSFTLKTNKPKYDEDLLDSNYFFKILSQHPLMIDDFLEEICG